MPKGATAGPGLEPGTSDMEVRGSNRSATTAPPVYMWVCVSISIMFVCVCVCVCGFVLVIVFCIHTSIGEMNTLFIVRGIKNILRS